MVLSQWSKATCVWRWICIKKRQLS